MTTTVQQYHQVTGTLIIRQAHSENRHPHVVDEIPKA